MRGIHGMNSENGWQLENALISMMLIQSLGDRMVNFSISHRDSIRASPLQVSQVPTSNTFFTGCIQNHSTGWGVGHISWFDHYHPKLVNGCCATKYHITFFYFCKVWPTTKVLNFEKACTVAMLHSHCGHFLLAGGPARFVSGNMFLAVRMDYHQRVSLEFTWTLTRPQIGNYSNS